MGEAGENQLHSGCVENWWGNNSRAPHVLVLSRTCMSCFVCERFSSPERPQNRAIRFSFMQMFARIRLRSRQAFSACDGKCLCRVCSSAVRDASERLDSPAVPGQHRESDRAQLSGFFRVLVLKDQALGTAVSRLPIHSALMHFCLASLPLRVNPDSTPSRRLLKV